MILEIDCKTNEFNLKSEGMSSGFINKIILKNSGIGTRIKGKSITFNLSNESITPKYFWNGCPKCGGSILRVGRDTGDAWECFGKENRNGCGFSEQVEYKINHKAFYMDRIRFELR